MPQWQLKATKSIAKWATHCTFFLIPAGCSLRSAQFYALWWASEQSGTYFRAQNGRSHLTFNRIANFNAKIELGVC